MLDRIPEFIGNHPLLTLAFAGLLGALIYTEIMRRFRGFAELTPAQLTRLINAEDAALIDVSGQNDYESGHIVNAIHLPMSQFDPAAKPLVRLRDKPLAVYCKTGSVSEQAARKLTKAGFERVHWLSGGLQAWLGDQLPITRGRR